MKQKSLIEVIENNIFAIGRYWGSFNSSANCADGICSMHTGIEVADLNWTWNKRHLRKKDGTIIRQIKKNYDNLNLPFWWWVYPSGKSEKTKEILLSQGFKHSESIACMAIDLSSDQVIQIQKNNEMKISLVKDNRELKKWESVSLAGFEMPQRTRRQYNEFVKSFDISKKARQKLFLAYWQGEPVGTALLFLHGDAAGIYFVTTLSAYRDKGIALALVRRAMKYVQSSAYKYCVLQSSKEGFNVYLRAGFKEYCQADVYCIKD